MATNDLLAELGKESFKLDVDGEKRVCQARRTLFFPGALTRPRPAKPPLATATGTGADLSTSRRWC